MKNKKLRLPFFFCFLFFFVCSCSDSGTHYAFNMLAGGLKILRPQ
ncbi:hypothetical protein [Escherichia phage vB_EcoM_Lh1B]|nr:hypothetical protein [Escherichia phage vB_EcoM_Lh1B]